MGTYERETNRGRPRAPINFRHYAITLEYMGFVGLWLTGLKAKMLFAIANVSVCQVHGMFYILSEFTCHRRLLPEAITRGALGMMRGFNSVHHGGNERLSSHRRAHISNFTALQRSPSAAVGSLLAPDESEL